MKKLLVSLAAVAAVLTPTNAQAVESETPPAPPELISTGSVTIDTYTESGTLIDTKTFGQETAGEIIEEDPIWIDPKLPPIVYADGKGGKTSASGCRRVTITNEKSTVLRFTAFKFHTWTRWCWSRGKQVVTGTPTTGWSISDIDSQFYWKGVVSNDQYFYDYGENNGYPKSAYMHNRVGRFDNCVLKYGCIKTVYADNKIRSYYNGTWSWVTK